VRALRRREIRTAVVSSSRNCKRVLAAIGLTDHFEAVVDGNDAGELRRAGKPDPALFLEAACRLEVPPGRTALLEDALAGVEAGRRGRFALVIGVDHGGAQAELLAHGADVVVRDLAEVVVP
jgi:HAD superfamily hydrolase (TIGR01509 family)